MKAGIVFGVYSQPVTHKILHVNLALQEDCCTTAYKPPPTGALMSVSYLAFSLTCLSSLRFWGEDLFTVMCLDNNQHNGIILVVWTQYTHSNMLPHYHSHSII